MKKLLMLFAVVAFLGTTASAQCTKSKAACTKSKTACTKSKAASAKTVNAELPACPNAAAAKLASMDESIESRTCAKSGKTAYYKKNTCATSGKTYFQQVQFDGDSKTFVNVSPSDNKPAKAVKAELSTEKKACTKSKAACTKSKTASAKTVSLEKKACTKGTAKKSCCASKKAAAKSSTVKANNGQVKLVKEVSEK